MKYIEASQKVNMLKLTEDQVIDYLCVWLEYKGWKIIQKNKGHSRGIDIQARKNRKLLIVEAKGAKGNQNSHVTRRTHFNSGQIKSHFGKAIVKVLEQRHSNPHAIVAIALPEDLYIRKHLDYVISEVEKCNIKLFWVKSPTQVSET